MDGCGIGYGVAESDDRIPLDRSVLQVEVDFSDRGEGRAGRIEVMR